MKLELTLALAAVSLAAVPALSSRGDDEAAKVAEIGATIPAFEATAVATIDSRDTQVPTAYMIIGVRCGATPAYESRFQAVEDQFRSKGVDFVWVFPNRTETLESKQAWMKKLGLRGPMVDDTGAKIVQSLGCKRTAQVVLADAKGKVVFRGGIDDSRNEKQVERQHLAEAIRETLAGKEVSVQSARAYG